MLIISMLLQEWSNLNLHCLFFRFILFLLDDALGPSQQFFSHVTTFSWVEPVLSHEDKVELFAL